MRKSTFFFPLLLAFFSTNTANELFSQNIIEPSEIKAALEQISKDAKDTLSTYSSQSGPGVSNYVKRASKMDSLALLNQEGAKLVALFRAFNGAIEKLPAKYKAKLTGDIRKNWVKYQTAVAISGGEWNKFVVYRNEKMFPSQQGMSRRNQEYPQELDLLLRKTRNESAGKPLSLQFSYPVDGSYSMFRAELNGEFWGYMEFNHALPEKTIPGSAQLMARWTGVTGDVHYTYAETDYMGGVYYVIPGKDMKGGTVYELSLVWVNDPSEMKPYWEASCSGGNNFYPNYNTTLLAELAGVSAPIYSIYFRTNTWMNSFQLFNAQKSSYDSEKHLFTCELEDALDLQDLRGTTLLQPRLVVSERFFESNKQLDQIYHPVVANYLAIPRTGPVDLENVSELHPFEQARLVNKPFIYRLEEQNAKAVATIHKESNSELPNGYTFQGIDKKAGAIVRINSKAPPTITKAHFQNKLHVAKVGMVLEFESSMKTAKEAQYQEVAKALEKRIKERAAFFYAMEQRNCRRKGISCTQTAATFEKTERENLPLTIKNILNTPVKWEATPGKTTMYDGMMRLPGMTRGAAFFRFETSL